jgi:hypothetical protein
MVRGLSRGFGRAAVFALVAMVLAPACAGRSISGVDDEEDGSKVPSGDDDARSGRGGAAGGSEGGVGAVGAAGTVAGGSFATGGAFATGGTVPTGGTFATGGTFPMGGTSTSGGSIGTAGAPSGGFANFPGCDGGASDPIGGSGGARPINTAAECRGISRGMPCPTEGTMCPNLPCGLADGGRRQCACANLIWECTSCDFTGSPWVSPPCDLLPCPAGIADEVACTSEGTVCGPDPSTGEYCACWLSPSDGLSWDCDNPPPTWGL